MIDVVQLDTLARERVMRDHLEGVTGMSKGTDLSAREREEFADEFCRFANWASGCGVRSLPASGHVVGFYLLDLQTDSALTGDIERMADAIVAVHSASGNYLDLRPIEAALKVIHKRVRRS
jgi:hypothetical protein